MGGDSRPEHVPTLSPHEFEGVFLAHSPVVSYNSSLLVEPYRKGWGGLYAEPIEHLYWIVTSRGVNRAWGMHHHTVDRYSAVVGTIEVALFDGRLDSGTSGRLSIVTLSGDTGDGLLIPVGVWHTLRSTTETAVLLNSKTPPYNADHVDKQLTPLPEELAAFAWPA